MPKVITVIESYETEGNGKPENPYRSVLKHYTFEGDLIVQDHSYIYELLKESSQNNIKRLEKEKEALRKEYIDLAEKYNTLVMSADKRKASRDLASKRKK